MALLIMAGIVLLSVAQMIGLEFHEFALLFIFLGAGAFAAAAEMAFERWEKGRRQ